MDRIEVHKFGGTSMLGAERLHAAASILLDAGRSARIVAVASAMAGVTNQLLEAAQKAAQGDRAGAMGYVEAIRALHDRTLEDLGGPGHEEIGKALQRLVGEFGDLVGGAVVLGEVTTRTKDRIVAIGEKLSVRLLTQAIRNQGGRAVPMDADTFLETDGRFGEASPVPDLSDRMTQGALLPLIEAGTIPVVTGFCGRAPDGGTTTLGRGGSDYSATLVAAALDAHEVTIWTDVSGVFTTDPRVVPEARVIEQVHYREAAEMSYYGAKVLHQRTMIPISRKGIPVRVRNSMRPEDAGTTVNGRFTPGSHPVKSVSAIREQCLISVEGQGMSGVPGVAARLFQALASCGISVTMVSQSSSEASICLAVPGSSAEDAEAALKREFREETARGDIEEIVVRRGVGLVAAVGLGMAHTPGVASRVFAALGHRRINILAIAQGSSELNITLAVDREDVDGALRAIHEELDLHRLDTGAVGLGISELLLVGFGGVGRELVRIVESQRSRIREQLGIEPRIVGVADRSGYVIDPHGLTSDQISMIDQAKSSGQPIAGIDGAIASDDPERFVVAATDFRLGRPILVDCTDADRMELVYAAAMARGCDVVAANKKPIADSPEGWRAILEAQARHSRLLRCEATVGAGLPIISTLEMLRNGGDEIFEIEGCLSGTLGFLMMRVGDGVSLIDALQEAINAGYTEPDPVADLSGRDVARKATILGRLAGLVGAETRVQLEGLADDSLAGRTRQQLLDELKPASEKLAQRLGRARANGRELRFVATIARDSLVVGLKEVEKESPLGRLTGTDNMVLFRTRRYAERPLAVIGAGAGGEVTAAGVFDDILKIMGLRR